MGFEKPLLSPYQTGGADEPQLLRAAIGDEQFNLIHHSQLGSRERWLRRVSQRLAARQFRWRRLITLCVLNAFLSGQSSLGEKPEIGVSLVDELGASLDLKIKPLEDHSRRTQE